jgi:sodium/potassium-transporting ATPase subunit alpha
MINCHQICFKFAFRFNLRRYTEGLPATVTSLLSIAARRLSARHILVKDTGIIESLGSCTARPPPLRRRCHHPRQY